MSVRAVEYICTFVPLRCTLILYPVPVIIRAEPRLQFFILRFNFLTELWLVFCDVSCVWTYMIHLAISWQLTHRPTIMWHCLSHRLSVYAVSVHRRLGIAGSIMAQLDKVWRQQRLSLFTKLRIYTSLVQSVVLYGSETWTMRVTPPTAKSWLSVVRCVWKQSVYLVKCFIPNNTKAVK